MAQKTKTSKAKKAKTTTKKTTPVETTAPVETMTPVETTAPVETTTSVETTDTTTTTATPIVTQQFNYTDEFSTLQSELKAASVLIKSLLTKVNDLEKKTNKDRKFVEKKLKSKLKKNTGNTLNGFSKPGPVSDELRKFLCLGPEDLIARTEVTKKITEYCHKNKLQNEKDKRIILADAPLRKLLRLTKNDSLTYFNLQKYMKIHFPNKEGNFPTA